MRDVVGMRVMGGVFLFRVVLFTVITCASFSVLSVPWLHGNSALAGHCMLFRLECAGYNLAGVVCVYK